MLVTLLGIVMPVILQPSNDREPIVVKPSGKVIEAKFEQRRKAPLPILVRPLLGRVAEVRELQL